MRLRLALTAIALLGFVVALGPGTAEGRVAGTSLEGLADSSDQIVIGQVAEVDIVGGHKVATLTVAQTLKGSDLKKLRYRAQSTWRCDTSTAVVGERVLLFLEALDGNRSPFADQPNSTAKDSYFAIAHAGRGRMPIREVNGKTYVEISFASVTVPEIVATIDAPVEDRTGVTLAEFGSVVGFLQRPLSPDAGVLAPSSPVSADSLVAAKREGDSLRDLGDLKSARRVWTRIVEEYRRQGSPAGDAEVAAWAQFEIAQQDASELDRVGLNGTEGEQTREKVAAASTADRSYAKVCVICAGEPCLAAEFEQGQLYERFAADILQRTPSPPANMNEHRCDVDCLMTSVSINSHEHRAKEMRGAARDRYQSALKRCDNARLASSPFCERIRAGLQRLPEESPSLYKSLSESARSRPDGGVPDSAVR